jgi:predicted RNA binding protein YcfA (HicA-like mRNA interferase family)
VKFRDLVETIEHDGWTLVRTKSSHRQFKHPLKAGTVTVAGKPDLDVAPKVR